MIKLDKHKIRHSFLGSALWTEELDADYDVDDFMPSALGKALHIIDNFLIRAPEKALQTYVDHFGKDAENQLGHDIWLSINGHGAGFFDHQLGGDEDVLQEVCRVMRGDKTAYINQVWVSEVGNIFIE